MSKKDIDRTPKLHAFLGYVFVFMVMFSIPFIFTFQFIKDIFTEWWYKNEN